MLTPNGGVFGRNPKFNNVTVENNLTVNGDFTLGDDIVINDTLLVNGVATFRGGIISIPNSAAPTSNTVIGSGAGAALGGSATFNTLVGNSAGLALNTGICNVAIGAALGTATSGSFNTSVGHGSAGTTTGGFNVAVGSSALGQQTSGNQNVAIGRLAGYGNGAFDNTTAIGFSAAQINTASNITAVGANALDANTTGTANTAVGKDALGANATGANNVAIGNNAASANTTGSSLVAVGYNALQNTTGGINIGIGQSAGSGITVGIANIAIGRSALQSVQADNYNVGVGDFVLESCVGSSNTAVGFQAGRYINSGAALTSASNSIMIGSEARFNGNGETNQIVIAGTAGRGNGSNTTTIGNSSTTGTFIPAGNLTLTNGNFTAASSTGSANIGCQTVGGASLNLECGTSFNQIQSYNNNNALYITAGVADMYLRTATNQTRMTVGNDGNISIANGNLVMSTSGKGIDFSATANSSGTMTSELLSDYEEGTWTPTYAAGSGAFTTLTMVVQSATYTKIGRQVTVRGYIFTNNVSIGTASGQLTISGLPFTVAGNGFSAGSVSYAIDWATAPESVYANGGSTSLFVTNLVSLGGGTTFAQVSALTTGATADQNELVFSCTYFV